MSEFHNLISDPWISVQRRDGCTEVIAPWQITSGLDNPIVDIEAPRPDFRSALYQFLIGLLQTVCAPDDDAGWVRWWLVPPDEATLKEGLERFSEAFRLDGVAPRFMQDPSVEGCAGRNRKGVGTLLIDEPGAQGIKLNKDLFIKRGRTQSLSPRSAAIALITLQAMAPAGGAGHRVSLRGGGPLTTILLPDVGEPDTLFHRIWLNVLDIEAGNAYFATGLGRPRASDASVFPWMGSVIAGDARWPDFTIENSSALHVYWGMPRRIWLALEEEPEAGSPVGENAHLVTSYCTRPHGPNYTGPWRHPLSPYYEDANGQLLPVHPQPGGFCYRDWFDWTQGNTNDVRPCASVVEAAQTSPSKYAIKTRLWSSGFDMDNMKARCFYEAEWPVLHFPREHDDVARTVIHSLSAMASECAKTLRSQVRAAWLRRPKDHSDSTNNQSAAIQGEFFDRTEPTFFGMLSRLDRILRSDAPVNETGELGGDWHKALGRTAMNIFEANVPIEAFAQGDARRFAKARNDLVKFLFKKTNKDNASLIDQVCMSRMTEGVDR